MKLMKGKDILLFWIICRICNDSGIKSASDSVTGFKHNSMFVCFKKLVVQKNIPLCMQDLAAAMGHERFTGHLGSGMLSCKVIERVRKL
jgi:hypothetical protein